MFIKTVKTTLALAIVLIFALTATADMQSTNYTIPASVLSGGGTSMDSASYQMTATIGQSSTVGQSSSSSYITYAGFWQPSEFKIREKAMPWIPLLLLED